VHSGNSHGLGLRSQSMSPLPGVCFRGTRPGSFRCRQPVDKKLVKNKERPVRRFFAWWPWKASPRICLVALESKSKKNVLIHLQDCTPKGTPNTPLLQDARFRFPRKPSNCLQWEISSVQRGPDVMNFQQI